MTILCCFVSHLATTALFNILFYYY